MGGSKRLGSFSLPPVLQKKFHLKTHKKNCLHSKVASVLLCPNFQIFKNIPNSYIKYPIMTIFSHELQNKQVWIEFPLTFYPCPSLPQRKRETKRKKFRTTYFFRGDIFLAWIFSSGDFFLVSNQIITS